METHVGLILAIDDLAPDMFVAIHSVRQPRMFVRQREPVGIELDAPQPSAPVMPGVPMKIIAVSLPFAACSILEPGGKLVGLIIVDLRHMRLCRVSDEFVDAITTFGVEEEGDEAVEAADDEAAVQLLKDISPGETEE